MKQRLYWQKELKKQRKWIDDHGGCLEGYVDRYGSGDDYKHYGDGGELIYAADIANLKLIEMHCRQHGLNPL
jgi:hypothetical protein